MKKRKKLLIKGRVQKVAFRASCMETALKYNVFGNVRNTVEGDVYVDAEGKEKDLLKFVAWCHKGPFWAKVTTVEQTDDSVKGYDIFEIIR